MAFLPRLDFSPGFSYNRGYDTERGKPVMTRRLTALLLALALLLSLTACGGRSNYTTDKLRVWVWDQSQVEALEALAAPWAEKTKIEVEITAKDPERYWADVSTGLLPDLMWVDDAHLPSLAASGALTALDQPLKENRKLGASAFSQAARNALTWQGSAYALPIQMDSWALWYNQAIFDSVQQSYPDDTWTWERVEQAAEAITNRNSGCYGIVIPLSDTAAWYQVIYAYGGRVVGQDETGKSVAGWTEDATVAAMKLLGRLITNAMPSQPAMDQLGAARFFANGSAGMILLNRSQGQAMLQKAGAGKWACTLLPYVDLDGDGACTSGERVCLVGASGWAIPSSSTDANAALELLELLGGTEARATLHPAPEEVTDAEGQPVAQATPLAAYDRMEQEAALLNYPLPESGEDWDAYAVSTTLKTAWNDPTRMESMLMQQYRYTQSQLDSRKTAEDVTEKS